MKSKIAEEILASAPASLWRKMERISSEIMLYKARKEVISIIKYIPKDFKGSFTATFGGEECNPENFDEIRFYIVIDPFGAWDYEENCELARAIEDKFERTYTKELIILERDEYKNQFGGFQSPFTNKTICLLCGGSGWEAPDKKCPVCNGSGITP